MIETIKKQIDASLSDFLHIIKKEYHLHRVNPILFESIKDFSLRSGKRIRPLLLVLSYKGYSKKNIRSSTNLYNASVCMELLHNFMLVHDDIIDRSDLRRGKPTLHRMFMKAAKTNDPEKLGYDLGIIAGDIIYALAIDAFLSIREEPRRKEKALKYFVQTAALTAIGEYIDILQGAENIRAITEQKVFLNYTLKTARYTFECPLIIGATLAGTGKKEIQKLSRLGIMVGQAFQIQDDILGVFGSEKNIGKSILSDLAESKKTLLVCHAYHALPIRKRAVFLRHFLKPKKTYRDLMAVRNIFIESGSLAYSLHKVESLVGSAQDILRRLKMKQTCRALIRDLLLSSFNTSRTIAKSHNIDITVT